MTIAFVFSFLPHNNVSVVKCLLKSQKTESKKGEQGVCVREKERERMRENEIKRE